MTYEQTLEALCLENEDIIVMTAENRAVIRGLPEKLGPRFIDVGISEMTQVGMAAGLALRGRIPITHALSTFLVMRAFEFIRTDVGIAHLPVKLVGGFAGFLSEANGPTHQAIEDIALMAGIPGMEVFCPADEEELLTALPVILKRKAPCYIRFNATQATVEHTGAFEMGKAETWGTEGDVTLLTYGFLLEQAEGARQILEKKGIKVRLVNMRTLAPVDEAAIVTSAQATRTLFTIEDHFQRGGLYTIASEVLYRHGVLRKVVPIGLDATWFKPARMHDVLEHEGFTAEKLAHRVMDTLGRR